MKINGDRQKWPIPLQLAKSNKVSFDRFKILADVAPGSKEYKIWRNIAKHTIQDPELIEEMKEKKDIIN